MRELPLSLRQTLWIACACVLLLPRFAAAEPASAVDFDGDGRHDHVTLDLREPSVVHIWLSLSQTTQTIRAHAPLQQIVAVDLDGDHRPELIARDRDARIHVWTRKHERFRRLRPRD